MSQTVLTGWYSNCDLIIEVSVPSGNFLNIEILESHLRRCEPASPRIRPRNLSFVSYPGNSHAQESQKRIYLKEATNKM